MKKVIFAFGVFAIFFSTLILSGTSGCGSKSSPANPGPTPTATCVSPSGVYGITGDTTDININNIGFAIRVHFPNNVEVTGFGANLCSSDTTSAENMDTGIYADVSGAPGTLLAPAVTMPVSTCATYTFALSNNLVLPAGYYWLAIGGTDASARHYYVQTGVSSYEIPGEALPNTFPTTTSDTITSQIWANWTCP